MSLVEMAHQSHRDRVHLGLLVGEQIGKKKKNLDIPVLSSSYTYMKA